MEVIRVEYKPFKFLNWTRKISKRIPGNWYEATENDLVTIARYLCLKLNNSQFIGSFLNVPRRITNYFTEFELWNIAQRIKLIEQRDPMDKFLITELKAGKYTLKAPKPLLKDVSFGAFVFFDNFFTDYAYGNKKALDKMIAYLYTCQEAKQDEIIDALNSTEYALKFAIYENYGMVRNWLGLRYSYVFVNDTKKKTGKKKEKPDNWLPILDSIIADDLANSEKYEKLPLHTVMRMLNNKIKEGYKRGKI